MDELIEIQERLAAIAKEREAELLAEHEKALLALAKAQAEEYARQAAVQESQRIAKEKAANAKKALLEAEEKRLAVEREYRLKIEHEYDAAQAKLERDRAQQAEVDKQLADLEHTHEMVRKQLADAAIPKNNADFVPEYPMARFLQHTPD